MPIGWPWSRVSSSASSSAFRSIRSAILQSSCARAAGASERHAPPGAERLARTCDCGIDVGGVRVRDLGDDLSGRRVDRFHCGEQAPPRWGGTAQPDRPRRRAVTCAHERLRVSARGSGAVLSLSCSSGTRSARRRRRRGRAGSGGPGSSSPQRAPMLVTVSSRRERIREVATASLEPPLAGSSPRPWSRRPRRACAGSASRRARRPRSRPARATGRRDAPARSACARRRSSAREAERRPPSPSTTLAQSDSTRSTTLSTTRSRASGTSPRIARSARRSRNGASAHAIPSSPRIRVAVIRATRSGSRPSTRAREHADEHAEAVRALDRVRARAVVEREVAGPENRLAAVLDDERLAARAGG